MLWNCSEEMIARGLQSCETMSCSRRVAHAQLFSCSPCRKSRRRKNPGNPELSLLGWFNFAQHSRSTSHHFIPRDIPFRLILLPSYSRMFLLKGKKRKPYQACVFCSAWALPGLYLGADASEAIARHRLLKLSRSARP